MKRIPVLDGLRGYFLVFMMLTHVNFAFHGGYWLVRLNHAELGFVQDAQGFIFLSGLLVGLVYAPRMVRYGFGAGAARMWRRAGELYVYAVGCIAAVVLIAVMLPHAAAYWDDWLGAISDGRPAFLGAAALLLYQPTFMDILPQYILYLLASPAVMWLCLTGRWSWVAVGMVVLWLAVQLGAHFPPADAVNQLLGSLDKDLWLRVTFNALAWQILFMTGVLLGTLSTIGAVDWNRVFDPNRLSLFRVAAVVLVFFLAWRLGFSLGVIPQAVGDRFRAYEVRGEFSLVFLVNFVAAAYAVGWLLVAGPRSASPQLRLAARLLDGLFQLRFLRLLGRHSLQVYAWHVLLVYAIRLGDWHLGPLSQFTKTVIGAAAIAALAVPALLLEPAPRPAARPAG